ncbi:hypothetical protein [Flyfo podovirus Tbat2_2]|nr:hypothetical protein [Flyfo podovirus Tbat2_2]
MLKYLLINQTTGKLIRTFDNRHEAKVFRLYFAAAYPKNFYVVREYESLST